MRFAFTLAPFFLSGAALCSCGGDAVDAAGVNEPLQASAPFATCQDRSGGSFEVTLGPDHKMSWDLDQNHEASVLTGVKMEERSPGRPPGFVLYASSGRTLTVRYRPDGQGQMFRGGWECEGAIRFDGRKLIDLLQATRRSEQNRRALADCTFQGGDRGTFTVRPLLGGRGAILEGEMDTSWLVFAARVAGEDRSHGTLNFVEFGGTGGLAEAAAGIHSRPFDSLLVVPGPAGSLAATDVSGSILESNRCDVHGLDYARTLF